MPADRIVTLQGGSNGADALLVVRARAGNPRRRWWWGIRTRDGRSGAWCYLCDRFVATWSGRWPATVTASLEIAAHRTDHIQGTLPTVPATTE